jgi:hypothetical protein
MKKLIIKSLLYFSLIVLFSNCKKYQTTTIKGKLINISVNKGIAGETIILNTYSNGGIALPDKAKITQQTITDNDGAFEFTFEAYVPYNEKGPSYGVEVFDSKKKFVQIIIGYDNSTESVDIGKYYNDDLLPFAHVDKHGEINFININVVTACRLKIITYNNIIPTNDSDELKLQFINKFGTFTYGYFLGKLNGYNEPDTYEPSVITGETTIRATITKNGTVEIRDTTFFVEDKEYNLVYRY